MSADLRILILPEAAQHLHSRSCHAWIAFIISWKPSFHCLGIHGIVETSECRWWIINGRSSHFLTNNSEVKKVSRGESIVLFFLEEKVWCSGNDGAQLKALRDIDYMSRQLFATKWGNYVTIMDNRMRNMQKRTFFFLKNKFVFLLEIVFCRGLKILVYIWSRYSICCWMIVLFIFCLRFYWQNSKQSPTSFWVK